MFNLGPFLRKELVVIARRRRTFWLRAGTLGVLSVLMIPLLIQLIWQTQRSYSVKGVADVLFQIFVWAQFALLVMVAPAFSAGAISYERRLGTIDLLKLAAIRPPALTLGKFLGAAALPFLLVSSEVPFLFIWTLFGGISPDAIAATLALSTGITVLLIAIGLFTSAVADTAGIAMVISYVLAGVYIFSFVFVPRAYQQWLIPVALAHSLRGGGLTFYPWWKASGAAFGAGFLLATAASFFLVQPPSVGWVLDRTSVGSRVTRRSRRVWSYPVLWREITCGGGARVTAFLIFVTMVSLACLAGAALVPDDDWRYGLGAVTVALPPIAGGVLGAISISLEKEGRSMAALLLMPSAATSVVLGKFAGACTRALPLAIVPFLLGFVRLEPSWMIGSATSALISMLLIATGVLFSVIFARSAVSVAVTFAGTIFYSFCCCYNIALFPFMIMNQFSQSQDQSWILVFGITAVIYGVIVGTVLAVAIGMFESRAREAI